MYMYAERVRAMSVHVIVTHTHIVDAVNDGSTWWFIVRPVMLSRLCGARCTCVLLQFQFSAIHISFSIFFDRTKQQIPKWQCARESNECVLLELEVRVLTLYNTQYTHIGKVYGHGTYMDMYSLFPIANDMKFDLVDVRVSRQCRDGQSQFTEIGKYFRKNNWEIERFEWP